MTNRSRFVKQIENICNSIGASFKILSDGWIIQIRMNNKNNYVFGYRFPHNGDTTSRLCDDKAATSEVLSNHNIPCVTHKLIHNYMDFSQKEGNWKRLITFFEDQGQDIVVKPNNASGGSGIVRARSYPELEIAVHRLFEKNRTFSISPYYEIESEYRLVYLNGEIRLLYRKNIPKIIGDGKKNVFELVTEINEVVSTSIHKHLNEVGVNLNDVLEEGQTVELGWKHNLGGGAIADLNIDDKLIENNLKELAVKVAKILSLKFASIDIIQTSNQELKVIEVNSGVMLVNFSAISNKHFKIANEIYKEAILTL